MNVQVPSRKRLFEEIEGGGRDDQGSENSAKFIKTSIESQAKKPFGYLSIDKTAANELESDQDKQVAFNIINQMFMIFYNTMGKIESNKIEHSITKHERYYSVDLTSINVNKIYFIDFKQVILISDGLIQEIYVKMDDTHATDKNMQNISFIVMKNEYKNTFKYVNESTLAFRNSVNKEPTIVNTKQKLQSLAKQMKADKDSKTKWESFPKSFESQDINTIDSISKDVHNMHTHVPNIDFKFSILESGHYLLSFDGVFKVEYSFVQNLYKNHRQKIEQIYTHAQDFQFRQLNIILVPHASNEKYPLIQNLS